MNIFKGIERISLLIVKRRLNALSQSEEAELQKWESESAGNKELSDSWLGEDYLTGDYQRFSSADSKRALKQFTDRTHGHAAPARSGRSRRKLIYGLTAAACLLLAGGGLTLMLRQNHADRPNNIIVGQALPAHDIQLISGDRVMTFGDNAEIKLTDEGSFTVTSEGRDVPVEFAPEVPNRLIVPFGKLSSLTLSDGTRVWINAGSEFEFPARFTGDTRRVGISGEMYIEVAPDARHPFVVTTGDFEVTVLGTRFNVRSYEGLSGRSVVLVEGKVSVDSDGQLTQLSPGQMFDLTEDGPVVNEVDVKHYVSWKDGYIIADETPVFEILKRVARYYNVEFEYDHSRLQDKTLTGRLILTPELGDIMRVISDLSGTAYEQTDHTIFINELP